MSTERKAPLPVRTFAADLEYARSKTGAVTPATTATPTTPVVTPTPAVQTHDGVVPPFHTFSQKNTAETVSPSLTASTPAKVITVGANVTAADVANEVMPAVIITDTKHKRFKLREALAQSVSSWWGNKKENALKKKIPKYTVPEPERRKGVIQKATAKTGVTSSSDHAAVVARIKATKQVPHATTGASAAALTPITTTSDWETSEKMVTPVVVAPKAEIPDTSASISNVVIEPKKLHTEPLTPEVTLARQSSWDTDIQARVNALGNTTGDPATPSKIVLTGKEFSKIKQQRTLNASVQKITPTIPELTPAAPEIKPLDFIAAPAVPVTPRVIPITPYTGESPVIVPTPTERPKITPTIPRVPGVVKPIAPVVASVPQPAVVVEQPNIFQTQLTEAEQIRGITTQTPERRFAPPREEKRSFITNLTQTNQLVFISTGVLIFVIASGLGLRSYLQGSSAEESAAPEAMVTTFPSAVLYDAPVSTSDKTALMDTLVSRGAGSDSLVEINFIDPASGQNLTARSLFTILETSVLFDFESAITKVALGSYRGAPWILLSTTDKNTALGGMLEWEKTIGSDLSPIYGEANTTGSFTDAVVGTTDVRVLKNSAGTEQIIYGFIDTNKVLITNNTTAFLNLESNF